MSAKMGRRIIGGLLLFAAMVLAWHILTLNSNQYLYPSPANVINSAIEIFSSYEIIADSLASLSRLAIGFLLGLIPAVAIGLVVARILHSGYSAGGLFNFLRFIPPLALVPLTILWFGIGEFSKYFIIAWTVFFPVYISTLAGAENINKNLIWVARSMGATKGQMFLRVILPAAMPFIVAGARVGLGIAFSVIIAAELVGAFSGFGFRIWFFHSVFRVDKMLVYIMLLGIYGIIADRLLKKASNKFFFWGEKNDA